MNRLLGTMAAVSSLILAACGGGGSSAGSTASNAPVPPLTIAVFAINAAFAHVYVAEAEGYFQQSGVTVNVIDGTAANTLNLVVAGQADLGMIGAGTALLPVSQGKETSIVYAHIGNANGGVVVTRKGITSMSQIKRMAATTPGTSSYGYANFYKINQHLNYDIVPFQDVQTMRAALASGQVDGACNSYVQFQDLIANGQVNVLIDTRDPAVRKQYVGPDYPEAAIFGMTDNLNSKKQSMIRFLHAIGLADKFIDSHTPDQIAASLRKVAAFQTVTLSALTAQVVNSVPYYAPNHGYISASVWAFAMSQYKLWGLQVDPSNSEYSYQRRVNMSFYDAGIGKPSGS